jgi:hypothetical protein
LLPGEPSRLEIAILQCFAAKFARKLVDPFLRKLEAGQAIAEC